MILLNVKEIEARKFSDPQLTANGDRRASVDPRRLDTLWINTGSLCNLACENCYIESTPTNDRLSFITLEEVRGLLDEIEAENMGTRELGFTGGEPFLNPDMMDILALSLARGMEVLVLTNAMNTMWRERDTLADLHERYGDRLRLRVSLDHYRETMHAKERGPRSWKPAMRGLKWLSDQGLSFTVAGRTFWGEGEAAMREGYRGLFAEQGINLDAGDTSALILFPEMDEAADVPEITVGCWEILDKDPGSIMCASSRMVVKEKGQEQLSIMACTLLPYDQRFNMGSTLKEAWRKVSLNHPHCSRFCVLGGGSCSG